MVWWPIVLLYLRRLICRISIPPCLFFAWLPYSASARPGPPSYIGCSPIGDARDQREEAGPGRGQQTAPAPALSTALKSGRLRQGPTRLRGLLVAGCRCILIARTGLRMLPLGTSRSKTENPTSRHPASSSRTRSVGRSVSRSLVRPRPPAGRGCKCACIGPPCAITSPADSKPIATGVPVGLELTAPADLPVTACGWHRRVVWPL